MLAIYFLSIGSGLWCRSNRLELVCLKQRRQETDLHEVGLLNYIAHMYAELSQEDGVRRAENCKSATYL